MFQPETPESLTEASPAGAPITPRLLDGLYTEAMLLADEARACFERGLSGDGDALHPMRAADTDLAVAFSCESLKVTTRLMHCIAWLLSQKALHGGDLSDGERWNTARALGQADASDAAIVERFPTPARQIVAASEDLHDRLARLEARLNTRAPASPAVHALHRRLQKAF